MSVAKVLFYVFALAICGMLVVMFWPGFNRALFYVFALATCGGAIAVVVSQNVVRMAFWLVVSLGSVAGLFFLLRADFVAATQLLIYVGGTVVLLVFGVMLTASAKFVKITTSPAEGFLAGGVAAMFLTMIISTVAAVDWTGASRKIDPQFAAKKDQKDASATQGNTARRIGMALMVGRPDKDLKGGANAEKAKAGTLSTGYLLPFEIISVHLLVVLIGAAYLARAKRRASRIKES